MNKTQITILKSLRDLKSVTYSSKAESRLYTQAMNLVFDGVLKKESCGKFARSMTTFTVSEGINIESLLKEVL